MREEGSKEGITGRIFASSVLSKAGLESGVSAPQPLPGEKLFRTLPSLHIPHPTSREAFSGFLGAQRLHRTTLCGCTVVYSASPECVGMWGSTNIYCVTELVPGTEDKYMVSGPRKL